MRCVLNDHALELPGTAHSHNGMRSSRPSTNKLMVRPIKHGVRWGSLPKES
jgi:hypothetical protein